MTIKFILKNGVSFDMKCEEFTLNTNGFGQITGYSYKGAYENQVLHLDIDEIAACLRV